MIGVAAIGAAGFLSLARCPQLEPPQRRSVSLSRVTIVNPMNARLPASSLSLAGGRLMVSAVPPASIYQFAGSYVLPGLIDMHVHLPPSVVPGQTELFNTLFLAHGVTTIRETGSFASRVFDVRQEVRSGQRAGPRIFACGEVLDGDPPTWPLARAVHDAASARAAVDDLVARGANCIKVMSNISSEALTAIREAARAHGLPLIGHLPAISSWNETRLDEIEHVCDPRCWSLGPSQIDELVETAMRAGIAHTPTLVVYENQLRAYDFETSARTPLALRMPRFWRDVIWNPLYRLGFEAPAPSQRAQREAAHRAMAASIHEAVRRLHQAGVRVYAGTDPFNPFVVPGASLHEEMRLLTESGFTLEEAWAAATWQAGEALGLPGLGRIETGAPADFLIFREDPTRNFAALGTLEAVVADGRLYTKDELDASLTRQGAYFESAWFDALSVAAARLVATAIAGSE